MALTDDEAREKLGAAVRLKTGQVNPLHHGDLLLSVTNHAPFGIDRDAGLVTFQPKLRKVAIVAGGPSKYDAPYGDASWEVWGLNVCPSFDRERRLRADRWWEMHPIAAQSEDDMRWLARCPFPVYMPARTDDEWSEIKRLVPRSVRYPLGDIMRSLTPMARTYFTCSFAFQFALALVEGFDVIGLYGVDLPWGSFRERTLELACVAWWAGYAEARGVRVEIPRMSPTLRHPYLYGYDYEEEMALVKEYEAKFWENHDALRGVADALDAGVDVAATLKVD